MNPQQTRLQVPGYQVMEFLGKGARSTIWQIRERNRNRFYALKRVVKHPGDDDRFFQQAISEFQIARNFDHPGIRTCYRLRRLRRWFKTYELHLFMELCEGSSCQAKRPTDILQAARIFLAVAHAISHMHAKGFLHGDLKPNNIIYSRDGTVKIIDFGQSCPIGTIKERIQGTPDFIAPEQVRCRPLDQRTDVFNFGAALYWTLTGQAIPTILPKEGNGAQLLYDLQIKPPEKLNPEIPSALARLVLDCVEPHPSHRPQTMKEVAARLDLIIHSLTRGDQQGRDGDDELPEGVPKDLLDGIGE